MASSSGPVMLLTWRVCFKNNKVTFLPIMLPYDETFFERPTWYPEGGHLKEVQLKMIKYENIHLI